MNRTTSRLCLSFVTVMLFAFGGIRSSAQAERPFRLLDIVKRKMNKKQDEHANHSTKHACQCTLCKQYAESDLQRAGRPDTVAWYAVPSSSFRYFGYYVGGSTPFWSKGDPNHPHEGTWGWDYLGDLIKRKVNLAWLHGRNDQRHSGSYETDGPKLLKHE